jgi:hypothetical protein
LISLLLVITKQQMLLALDGLIGETNILHAAFIRDLIPWSPAFVIWLKASESTVETIFGSRSEALATFRTIRFLPMGDEQFPNEMEKTRAERAWFESGLRFATATLIGYRYSVERLSSDPINRPTPNFFISHGGPTMKHVYAIRDLVTQLGLAPVIVQDLPNLNMSINDKVLTYMGLCSGGIALATVEDETTANEKRTRPNVENEIGMLQTSPNIGSRIIYLKERDVQFASNYKEKVWIEFKKERVQDVFVKIITELRAFSLLS